MSVTNSQRMQLVVESDDETVDPFAANWPILDNYAGALKVPNGTTPDPATLFDGSVIYEATSGISWMADLSSGSLVKRYLTYPFFAAAAKNGWAQSNAVDGNLQVPLDINNPVPTVNWDGILVSSQIKAPIRGIYYMVGNMTDQHDPNPNTFRSLNIRYNGTGNMYVQNEMIMPAMPGVTPINTNWMTPLNAGDLIGLDSWQNGSAPGNGNFVLTVELLSPAW